MTTTPGPAPSDDIGFALHCPCGQVLEGADEDEIVERSFAHLRDRHPDMADAYERADILAMAVRARR